MRRYHRWLSVLFGIFILWIATTGLLSQFGALYADATAPAPAAELVGFACPETMTCRPKAPPSEARAWVSFFHHIHSGEQFGAVGTAISILSGFALLFFAFSGLWMYVRMFVHRKRSGKHTGQRQVFWK